MKNTIERSKELVVEQWQIEQVRSAPDAIYLFDTLEAAAWLEFTSSVWSGEVAVRAYAAVLDRAIDNWLEYWRQHRPFEVVLTIRTAWEYNLPWEKMSNGAFISNALLEARRRGWRPGAYAQEDQSQLGGKALVEIQEPSNIVSLHR